MFGWFPGVVIILFSTIQALFPPTVNRPGVRESQRFVALPLPPSQLEFPCLVASVGSRSLPANPRNCARPRPIPSSPAGSKVNQEASQHRRLDPCSVCLGHPGNTGLRASSPSCLPWVMLYIARSSEYVEKHVHAPSLPSSLPHAS